MFKRNSLMSFGAILLILLLPVMAWGEESCCNTPGDANNSHSGPDILDVTYIISYLYKGGPAPDCMAEGDVNGNGAINVLDISYIIKYLYNGGPSPICGPDPWPED